VFFPVAQVTSCAFGGGLELSDLYVTSAAYRLSAARSDRGCT
jgi:sugar lactone lactonase YvrE